MSVYPRVCGVDLALPVSCCLSAGLSPRVRGRSCRSFFQIDRTGLSPRVRGRSLKKLRIRQTLRFIPACAG